MPLRQTQLKVKWKLARYMVVKGLVRLILRNYHLQVALPLEVSFYTCETLMNERNLGTSQLCLSCYVRTG